MDASLRGLNNYTWMCRAAQMDPIPDGPHTGGNFA